MQGKDKEDLAFLRGVLGFLKVVCEKGDGILDWFFEVSHPSESNRFSLLSPS